jgi:hypothetical protein
MLHERASRRWLCPIRIDQTPSADCIRGNDLRLFHLGSLAGGVYTERVPCYSPLSVRSSKSSTFSARRIAS